MLPKIVIKFGPGPETNRPRVFLAAIKDIQNDEAYEQAVKLLKRENGDSLLLFHVNNSSAGTTDAESGILKTHFTERIKDDGLLKSAKFVTALKIPGVSFYFEALI